MTDFEHAEASNDYNEEIRRLKQEIKEAEELLSWDNQRWLTIFLSCIVLPLIVLLFYS